MKILWIKAGPFLPLDTGGKIRTWNTLCELAKLDEVTALCYVPSSVADCQGGIEHSFSALIALRYPAPVKFSLAYSADYLLRLLSPAPYSVRKNVTSSVRRKVRELLETERFDLAICDFLSSSLNIPAKSSCPQVLFAHNVETMIWKRHFEVERNPLWRLVAGIEYAKMKRFEAKLARRFDHILTVSEVDRDVFQRFVPPERISVLPTGVDLEYFRPAPVFETDGLVIFVGSMDWRPNEDAILYFAREIFPEIARAYPQAKLRVVGRDPTSKIQRLTQFNSRVEVTGRVPDTRPHMAAAAVHVVPLRIGGGTRLKIYEAMAMGKAVVSTQVGAEGLPVKDGEHLLLADSPEKFSSAVIRLLGNPGLRFRLGQAAREFVKSRYGWPNVAKTCHDILADVAERSRSRSTAR